MGSTSGSTTNGSLTFGVAAGAAATGVGDGVAAVFAAGATGTGLGLGLASYWLSSLSACFCSAATVAETAAGFFAAGGACCAFTCSSKISTSTCRRGSENISSCSLMSWCSWAGPVGGREVLGGPRGGGYGGGKARVRGTAGGGRYTTGSSWIWGRREGEAIMTASSAWRAAARDHTRAAAFSMPLDMAQRCGWE